MREIKFRGFSKTKGEMKFGHFSNNILGTCYIENEDGIFIVEKETIGQFTGLYDKNEKEIYEGDILKTEGFSSDLLNEIYFDKEKASFLGKPISKEWYITLEGKELSKAEIIGNRYD